jgi:hypothetical protein
MRHLRFVGRLLVFVILFFLLDFLISLVLLEGLNKYFGFNQAPGILINGSSMTISGFNRKEIGVLTKMSIATYAYEGVSISDRYAMINHFYHLYPEGVRTVVYEINPVLFSNLKTADNVYTHFYPFLDDLTIDRYVKEKASPKEYYVNKIIRVKRFDSRLIRLIILGYLGKYENLKTNSLDTAALLPMVSQKGMTPVTIEDSNREVFERTMDLIRSHDAKILLVMMPMYYLKLQSFNKEEYSNLCKYLEDYCSSHSNVEFLNMNQDNLIYDARYFSDQLHFNVFGQQQITKIISSYLVDN